MTNIFNFYGFVEQIGSVFIEGPDGLLYPPNFTDIIIRRPHSWEPAEVGEEGVIQVVSLLPRSYPGHSVLTEDMGVVATIDAGPAAVSARRSGLSAARRRLSSGAAAT